MTRQEKVTSLVEELTAQGTLAKNGYQIAVDSPYVWVFDQSKPFPNGVVAFSCMKADFDTSVSEFVSDYLVGSYEQ